MWDSSRLFGTQAPPEAEVPVDDSVANLVCIEEAVAEPPVHAVTARRRDLMERFERRSQKRQVRPPSPSVADALRDLNELRLDGMIDEAEFEARKAELFT